jgi:hypothetical protein
MTTINTDIYYVSKKACRRGGHFLRFNSTGACVECQRIRDRERYDKAASMGVSSRVSHSEEQRNAAPKNMPAEALSETIERIALSPEQATHHVRQIVLAANPGPVQDAFISVLQDASDRIYKWKNLPPLPGEPARNPTLANSNSFDSFDI